MPSAVTSAAPNSVGSEMVARSTKHVPSRHCGAKARAAAMATVVLPTPPAPASVTCLLPDQQIGDVRYVRFAADNAAQHWRPRQRDRLGQRQIVLDLGGAGLHIRNELVAAPSYGCDVDGLDLRIAQRPTQAPHIDLEIAVVDEDAGPGGRHQFILAHQFAAALHQQLQEFERAPAQFYGPPVEQKQLTAGNESKWAEGECQFLSACALLRCLRGNPH